MAVGTEVAVGDAKGVSILSGPNGSANADSRLFRTLVGCLETRNPDDKGVSSGEVMLSGGAFVSGVEFMDGVIRSDRGTRIGGGFLVNGWILATDNILFVGEIDSGGGGGGGFAGDTSILAGADSSSFDVKSNIGSVLGASVTVVSDVLVVSWLDIELHHVVP